MADGHSPRDGLRGGARLAGGALAAQLLTFAATPLLSRLYSPDAFGYLALVLAAVGLLSPIACLRLDSALLLPRSQSSSTTLFYLAATSALGMTLLVTISLHLLISGGLFPTLANLPGFAFWVGSISLLTSYFALTSQYALRLRRYSDVARRGLYQSITTNGVQIALAKGISPGSGLLVGQLLGRAAGIAPLLVAAREPLRMVRWRRSSKLFRIYWRFPALFTPSVLLNALGLAIPVLYVGSAFTVADAGQWGMADRILAAPVMLAGTAAGQMLETELAARRRQRLAGMTSFLTRTASLLAGAGLTLAVAIFLLADRLLPAFFGSGWETAIALLKVLAIPTALRLVAGPAAKVLTVLQLARTNLVLDTVRVVLLVAAVVTVEGATLDLHTAAVLFATAMSITYIATLAVCIMSAKRYDHAIAHKG